MKYTGSKKETVRILTELLVEKGVKKVVISPGSRNAPLIISLMRRPGLEHFVILDERSAAFFALGLSQQTGEPVALACTSGTALLNYGPAVAEAWYQRLPLVILSADRPLEWVDQDDSQTIRQNGVFSQLVKYSCQLPAEIRDEDERWYTNRLVNDALNCALAGRPGPVHINLPLREPLYERQVYTGGAERSVRYIDAEVLPSGRLTASFTSCLASCHKVMILAGFLRPDKRVEEALYRLAGRENVVVLTESLTNAGRGGCISTIDRVLSVLKEEEKAEYAPDLLISFGGPLISRYIKTYLRTYHPRFHWSIDSSEHPADTFRAVTTVVRLHPGDFLPELSENWPSVRSDYSRLWKAKQELAAERHTAYLENVSWSDLKAFSLILPVLPAGCRLQLSNSTPVRYAQLFEYPQVGRVDGNRGTSGIDGSLSTAVGASWATDTLTVLITGDMSFLYDSNALWNRYITPRFKMIVIKNGGGGIFRFIPGPSDLEELEECFETARDVDVEGFARLHRFSYYRAGEAGELMRVLPVFLQEDKVSAILEVCTPRYGNDRVLKAYFNYLARPVVKE